MASGSACALPPPCARGRASLAVCHLNETQCEEIGEALGKFVAKTRDELRDEFAVQLAALRVELTLRHDKEIDEVRAEFAVARARDAGTVLDLPMIPERRSNDGVRRNVLAVLQARIYDLRTNVGEIAQLARSPCPCWPATIDRAADGCSCSWPPRRRRSARLVKPPAAVRLGHRARG
jgi:hypothetical protein